MSLWRKPGTKTFQLVHRSQRDPLINDPEASDRVFKEIDTSQKSKVRLCALASDARLALERMQADVADVFPVLVDSLDLLPLAMPPISLSTKNN